MTIIRRKRANGRTTYGVRVKRSGKQVWIGSYPTIAEARRAEAKARLEHQRPSGFTADAWAEHWLETYRHRNKTSSYDSAASALSLFRDDFRAIPLERIDSIAAEKWARKNRWRVPVVVSLLNAAVDAELIERNPFKGLSHRTEGRRHTAPLTAEEITQLAEAAETPALRSLVLFLAYTGLRVGEAFALEWSDVDFEALRVRVERRVYKGEVDLPKSNRTRLCVLTPPARDALLMAPRTSHLIFTSKQGKRLSQPTLAWYWKTITAGFPRKVTPHELRHFAGHYLHVKMGLPDRVVAAQLGHSDGGKLVRELYGHGEVGALEEIDRAFENVVPLRAVGSQEG